MGNDNISTFNGVGFHTWQVKVKGYLMKKGLWSVITSNVDEENPPSRAQLKEMQIKDEKALGILLTSVADEIVHYLDQSTTAKHAWEILERNFGAKSKHSKISLKMQLYSLIMQEGEGLSSLVNRLKSICTQLSYIECNIEEEDKIAVLLKSLPLSYDNIVTVLKEKEPIPSLESIVNSLQEEEKKHTHKEENTSQALYVLSSSKKRFKPCKHCGKTNHMSNNCYKIKKCVKCGKLGHAPQFCPTEGSDTDNTSNNQRGKRSSHNIHYVNGDSDGDDDSDNDGNHSDAASIHLVSAYHSPTTSSPSTSSFSNKKHGKGSKHGITYDDIL